MAAAVRMLMHGGSIVPPMGADGRDTLRTY